MSTPITFISAGTGLQGGGGSGNVTLSFATPMPSNLYLPGLPTTDAISPATHAPSLNNVATVAYVNAMAAATVAGVSSVTGTANETTVSPTTGAVIVGLAAPSPVPTTGAHANPTSITTDGFGRVTAVASSATAFLTANQTITLTGPVTGTGTTTISTTLTPLVPAVTPGAYTFPTSVSVNAAGQVTAITGGSAPVGAVSSVLPISGGGLTVAPTTGTGAVTVGIAAVGGALVVGAHPFPTNVTVNALGQVTSISDGSAPAPGVTSIADLATGGAAGPTGTTGGLTFSAATGAVTASITATGVAANSYSFPTSVTVNGAGQVTAISAGTQPVAGITAVNPTANQIATTTAAGVVTVALAAPSPVPTVGAHANPTSITTDAFGRVTVVATSASAFLTANQSISLTGPVTGTGTTSIATSLTAISPALPTGAQAFPQSITVNAAGQVIAITPGTAPTAGVTSVTGTAPITATGTTAVDIALTQVGTAVTALANPIITTDAWGRVTAATPGAVPITNVAGTPNAIAVSISGGTATVNLAAPSPVPTAAAHAWPSSFTTDGFGRVTAVTSSAAAFLTANQTITLSGAVTGSGTTAIATTLAWPLRGNNASAPAALPGSMIQVSQPDNTNTSMQIDSSGTGVSTIELRKVGATMATPSLPGGSTQIGFLRMLGWTGAASDGGFNGGFEMQVLNPTSTVWTATAQPTAVYFMTTSTAEGNTTSRTIKLQIGVNGGLVAGSASNGDMYGSGTFNLAGPGNGNATLNPTGRSGLVINGLRLEEWLMEKFGVIVAGVFTPLSAQTPFSP